MTNSPPYDEQLVLLKQYEGLGGKKPIPGTMEAEDRFARGAFYLTKLPDNPVSYQAAVAGVLSVIRNMATPLGANDPSAPTSRPPSGKRSATARTSATTSSSPTCPMWCGSTWTS
jgi:penicillin V acylase-like amidase (Ntn superfamily)